MDAREERVPWIYTTLLATICALIGPIWLACLPGFPYFTSYNLGSIACHLHVVALPWIIMLLIPPLTKIRPLKKKITLRNLAYIYIATMVTAFYLDPHCFAIPGSIWVSDRFLNVPEDISLKVIPTYVAPPPDVCKQLIMGGVPIPWDQWVVPLAFWYVFDVAMALFMFSLTNIFRHHWIDIEKVPYPHTVAISELISVVTHFAEPRPSMAKKITPFVMGVFIGVFYQATVTLGAYFPWFPDLFGWRVNTCANGFWNMPFDVPAINAIVGWTGINKIIAVYSIAFFIPLKVLFNTWFWYIVYLIAVQISYVMGYYTNMETRGGCGKVYCRPSVMSDPPLVLAAVFNGGILAFVIMHLISIRGYLVNTLKAVFGKGELVKIERDEPMSYRMTYIILTVSLVVLMTILLALGSGPTGIYVPLTIFILFLFNLRLWGLTGFWAKGNNYHFGGIFGKYTFWPGPAPRPPTTEFIYSNVIVLIQDDPSWGWYGTACAAFASYRIASLAGISNKNAAKTMLGAMLVAPLYLISFLIVLYTLGGVSKIPAAGWMQGCGWASCAYRASWEMKPGFPETPQLLAGFITTVILHWLHARFIWFPFEPMGFLLGFASYPAIRTGYWFPCLIAWIAKMLMLRIGGSKAYEEVGMPVAGGILTGSMFIVFIGGILGIWRTFFPF